MKLSFLGELKRRNVFRAAVLYIGVIWALSQGAAQLLPVFDVSNWVVRWFIVAAVIGFPFWVAFAWFFELTPEGLKLESDVHPSESITAQTARKLDFAIIGVLSVAVVLLLTNQVVLHHGAHEEIAAPANSIAVLPFSNVSPDKNQDYFADGISEDLLNLLTRVPRLRVTARTSSFAFKGQEIDIRKIARKLHVAHVLEGTVRKVGSEVRITAQLVDVSTDRQLWSQSYDRKLTDVFKIQDQIAADVVKNLKVKLLGDVPAIRETDPNAYMLYLQARQLGYRRNLDGFTQSDALYRQALAIDPRYVPVLVGLGRNLINEQMIEVRPTNAGLSQARKDGERAIAIDPNYAPAYALLGRVFQKEGNLASNARSLRRALALDPSDVEVLRDSANLLTSLGRLQQAIPVLKYVVARDPINAASLYDLGLFYIWAGRYDSALSTLHTLALLSPHSGITHYLIGVALLRKHEVSAALAQMKQETSEAWRLLGLAIAYHDLKRDSTSHAMLQNLADNYRTRMSLSISWAYAYCGDADDAFKWLDNAVRYHSTGISVLPVDNMFDNIRSDPRWLAFLRKVGMAPDQLKKIKFKVTLPKAWQAGVAADGATASGGEQE